MGLRDGFATSQDRETQGVEVNFGDFSVTLARAGGANKRYSKVLAEKSEPYARAIELGQFDNDTATNLLHEVYAETVVLGWKGEGLRGALVEGEIPDCTPENVLAVFKDPDFGANFFAAVQAEASKLSLFKVQTTKAASGN